MTFNWRGRPYDTSTMRVFETGNPAMPVVYIVPGGEVFLVEIERLEGIEIRLASRDEATMLAQRHGFADLLPAQNQGVGAAGALEAREHALIVEDDGLSRHALQQLLSRSGYDIACAATIAEAVTKLEDHPRWLILDLQLPDGKGRMLLEQIRSRHLPIQVAITTGETDLAELSHVSSLKPDVIFHKPLDLNQIMHWLEAA